LHVLDIDSVDIMGNFQNYLQVCGYEMMKKGQICPRCISKGLKRPGRLKIAWKNIYGITCYECTNCNYYIQEKGEFEDKNDIIKGINKGVNKV
jgi:hypothetical protein